MNDTIELLKTDAAARELGISIVFLNKARLTVDGLRFIKIGGLVKPDPILHSESVIMVYGKTGVGKTHFALGCATAIATGGKFLKYHAPKPKKVYILIGILLGLI